LAKAFTMTILVVEDHPDTLHWLRLHLEEMGHAVLTANLIKQAESLLNGSGCDVLISDISLPDGSGCELLALGADRAPRAAIAMTGVGRNVDTTEMLNAGFRYHLFKPFPLVYLDRLLAELEGEMAAER
jgi:DNA-binding response OmpR family regulator